MSYGKLHPVQCALGELPHLLGGGGIVERLRGDALDEGVVTLALVRNKVRTGAERQAVREGLLRAIGRAVDELVLFTLRLELLFIGRWDQTDEVVDLRRFSP